MTGRKIIKVIALLFLCVALFQSCAHKRAGTKPGDTSPQGPREIFCPPEPQVEPVFGPEPMQLKPIVLVLGPGMARGFAYMGALEALDEAKIPIRAIVGTEMGALIGSLYAMNESGDAFQWSMMKFKDSAFPVKRGFLSALVKNSSDGKELREDLDQVLGKRDLSQSRIPLRVLIQPEGSEEANAVDHGPASATLRAAMSVAGVLEASDIDGAKVWSASISRPFGVAEARNIGTPVIVINVIGGAQAAIKASTSKEERVIATQLAAAARIGQNELKEADLVISPSFAGEGFLDFQKRSDIAFAGKKAVISQLPAIRKLVGYPESAAGTSR
jgi:NTE family protein